MFESAIEAASSAAREWTATAPDPAADHGACALCLRRYRVLVLDGPLRDLPHGVVHAEIVEVDEIIAEQIAAAADRFGWDGWILLLDEGEQQLTTRADAAFGGVLMVALEELGAADPRLADSRRRPEPQIGRYLASDCFDQVPQDWL